MPGFGMKVTPKGRKVFLVMYRLAGVGSRLRKYTIGPYGRVTLPMAKAQAQKIFAARLDERDPAEEKKQFAPPLGFSSIGSMTWWRHSFVNTSRRSGPTAVMKPPLLRRDVIPYWGAKSIHKIKKRDVSDLISLIAQRNAHACHRLLKTLKTFFRYAWAGRLSTSLRWRVFRGAGNGYRLGPQTQTAVHLRLSVKIVARQ